MKSVAGIFDEQVNKEYDHITSQSKRNFEFGDWGVSRGLESIKRSV